MINITITQETIQDYDGVDENVKTVSVEIDGACIKETYSYDAGITDATIRSEIEADLTAKGYTWQ